VFKNGIGTVDGGVGELTTGVDKITSAITANATYTLTVTGSEGQKVTKAVDVTALPSGKFTPTGAPNGKTVIPLAEVPHAVLPNGDVIANPDRMERYRLSTGEFESLTLSSPCSGRPHHLQALTSGLVLVTGCEAYEGAHMLDPETGNMTRTASLSMVREYPAVTLIHNDRVLFSGGCFGGADGVRESAELFDPKSGSNGSFALLTMTVSRSGHSSTLLDDGSVLLAGGMSGACGGGTILGAAELYVTSTTSGGSFVPTKSMNVVRRDHAAALIANGNVLITGGYNQSISPTGPVPLSSAEIFEKSSGTFRLLAASLTQPRWAHAMLPLKNGRIIIIGGDYSAEIFNPISETFTSTGSSPRTKGSAAVLPNGMVFLVGIDKATWNPSAELYCP
jgi:X-X-X-Leu-X-X-Gly heptad repeat protein